MAWATASRSSNPPMAVTGQDLPGFRKAANGRRREPAPARLWAGISAEIRRVVVFIQRLLAVTVFSSLTRCIIVLNLVALAVLVTGILYLNQWRAVLINSRVQKQQMLGDIIAAAIAA